MNLIVDIGNSRTKISIFNQGEEMISFHVDEFMPSHIELLKGEYSPLNKAILSSVKDYSPKVRELLQQNSESFIELNSNTPLPIENCYLSKETLGNDRIATAVGAFKLYPNSNILIIDAGTAITYDLVNDKNQYMGGNISPGLEMRFKALNHFTGRLPLVEKKEVPKLFGQSTEEAIRAGVQHGIVYEVDKTIDSFKDFYKNLYVIITGGDTKFFDKKLKNSFFVSFNLIAIGLNCILEHNGEI